MRDGGGQLGKTEDKTAVHGRHHQGGDQETERPRHAPAVAPAKIFPGNHQPDGNAPKMQGARVGLSCIVMLLSRSKTACADKEGIHSQRCRFYAMTTPLCQHGAWLKGRLSAHQKWAAWRRNCALLVIFDRRSGGRRTGKLVRKLLTSLHRYNHSGIHHADSAFLPAGSMHSVGSRSDAAGEQEGRLSFRLFGGALRDFVSTAQCRTDAGGPYPRQCAKRC